MKMFLSLLMAVHLFFTLACAGPQPHRFVFEYSPPQALTMIREILRENEYRIVIFDAPSGVIKTEPREFIGEDGDMIQFHILVTLIKRSELCIRVVPATAQSYRDQILGPLMESLKAAGIHPQYIPPPPSHPRYWRHPPLSPPIS